MTLPPPNVCKRMAQFHRSMGSPSANEADNAWGKLVKLLADNGCTWNDLPEILAADRANGSTTTGVPATGGRWGEPFRTPDGTAYVDIHVDGHRETWPVRSPGFRNYVRRQIFKQKGTSPGDGRLKQIVANVEAEAQFGGRQQDVHLRVGEHQGQIYIDLADDQWRVVEVAPDGWRIVANAPVRFRRTPGMLALPVPEKGGSVEELASFLNVQRNDLILIVSFLLAALRGTGPYPVLAICGEYGSAKSTLMKLLRALIDPNVAPIRSLPRSEQDLFVSADNNFVQPFDNISGLTASMSDALCRLATGAAFATRQIFTNGDETVLQATRPIILNGINNTIDRADLADRTIFLVLEPIANDRRRTEAKVLAAFEPARPKIFGALLDAAVRGLQELPRTKQTELTRMADFEMWATACESAMWPAGTFRQAYAANRRDAVENSVEGDLVATTIQSVLAVHGEFRGTATDLLKLLEQHADQGFRRADKQWPRNPEALRHRLDRTRTNLRKVGIEITYDRSTDRKRARIITISNLQQHAEPPLRDEIRLRPRGNNGAKGGAGGNHPSEPSEPSISSGAGNSESSQRAPSGIVGFGRSGRSGRSNKHIPH